MLFSNALRSPFYSLKLPSYLYHSLHLKFYDICLTPDSSFLQQVNFNLDCPHPETFRVHYLKKKQLCQSSFPLHQNTFPRHRTSCPFCSYHQPIQGLQLSLLFICSHTPSGSHPLFPSFSSFCPHTIKNSRHSLNLKGFSSPWAFYLCILHSI